MSRSRCSRRPRRSARTESRAACWIPERCRSCSPIFSRRARRSRARSRATTSITSPGAARSASPSCRRPSRTTATTSSRSATLEKWLGGPRRADRRLRPPGNARRGGALRGRSGGRRPHRRQRHRPPWEQEIQFRARLGHPRQGDGAVRGRARLAGQAAHAAPAARRRARARRSTPSGSRKSGRCRGARGAGARDPHHGLAPRLPTPSAAGSSTAWSATAVGRVRRGPRLLESATDPHGLFRSSRGTPTSRSSSRAARSFLRREGDPRRRLLLDAAPVVAGRRCSSASARLPEPQRLKGVHLAMKSGMLAAETAFEALVQGDFSAARLAATTSASRVVDLARSSGGAQLPPGLRARALRWAWSTPGCSW